MQYPLRRQTQQTCIEKHNHTDILTLELNRTIQLHNRRNVAEILPKQGKTLINQSIIQSIN
jgi:hypothetical protein